MNSSLWFYSDTRQTYGPVAVHQLTAMIQAGQLTAGHFIMPEGGQDWQAVASSPFAAYLPMTPMAPVATQPARQAAPPARVAGKPPPRTVQAPQPPERKSGPPVALIAIVTVVILAGAGWWLTRPAPTPAPESASVLAPERQEEKAPAADTPPPAVALEIRPSRTKGPKVGITFENHLSEEVDFEWVNFEGKHARWDSVKARSSGGGSLITYVGHTWLITTKAGQHLGMVEAGPGSNKVIIDSTGVRLENTPAPAASQSPADNTALRPSRKDGDASQIRFINKLKEEVKIQFVDAEGQLTKSWNLRDGWTINKRTHTGAVWLITSRDGRRIGQVESSTERCIALISSQGVEVKPLEVPNARSLLLVTDVQFTDASIGDIVALLRQRVAAAGLDAQILLDPKINPKAGRVTLDAHVIPLAEALEICAHRAGSHMHRDGSVFRILPN